MSPPRGTTSVVVVSYRPGGWLADCLASVVDQADEMVLVDNGSPGGHAGEVGRRFGARLVSSRTNLGFAGGVNLGLAHATGKTVALLNDDAVADPGWLASGREVLEDPTVAAVTPKVRLAGWWREVSLPVANGARLPLRNVTVDGEDVLARVVGAGVDPVPLSEQPRQRALRLSGSDKGGGRAARARTLPFYVPLPAPGRGNRVRIDGAPAPAGPECRLINNAGSSLGRDGNLGDYGVEAPDDGRFDAPAERFAVSGAAMMVRADTIARLGPLAARLFAYYEDSDWSWRARLAGLRMVYDPRSAVDHQRSATSAGEDGARLRRLAERNLRLVLVRNAPAAVARREVSRSLAHSGPGYWRALTAMLPWAVATRMAMSRRWQVRPEEVWERWAGVDTTWDCRPAGSAVPRP